MTKARALTLIGNGEVSADMLALCLSFAKRLFAADGGANRAFALGYRPEMVFGDFDSLDPALRAHLPKTAFIHLPSQEQTDFHKSLAWIFANERISTPILAVGFLGKRFDHALAALHTLCHFAPATILLLGAEDIVFLAPKQLSLSLPVKTQLSLFPLGDLCGQSKGLKWPIDGIDFSPQKQIGTSNEVIAPQVQLCFDRPAMAIILPRLCLDAALIRALSQAG